MSRPEPAANAAPDTSLDTSLDADVVIVGAGIIGVCCALRLVQCDPQQRILIIDRQSPGHGASRGNAGHMATEQVFPIADASILRRLPAMLLDPTGPLRLDWRYLPHLLPWWVRLLANLRAAPFAASVAGLRALNEQSLAAWRRLLTSIGRGELLKENGSLLITESPDAREALAPLRSRMAGQQVPVEFHDGVAVRRMAPQLSAAISGGLFFPATGQCLDSLALVETLAAAAQRAGVRFEQAEVTAGRVAAQGVVLDTLGGWRLRAGRVLIANGAHAAPLVGALTGVRIPLDTERGYHLMLPREHGRLPFPVTSLERRFIMTPMESGLRLAGTVEFAGLRRPPNMQRAWQLHRLSHGLFESDLSAESASTWMGFRPSLPDSLPIIDSVRNGRVLLALGHHHLGLTQAAITAEMIARLAQAPRRPESGEALPSSTAYRLARFA
ncbi:NAD(P)/FAD-dependent oxidoreductase [Kushneria aurantia]|uniref:NAD(P)/FAD-dependent oxidoreductase n=1 Tax=Kushneria aurantia TaxID=504092 RepID=A0ABV6G2F1_9GAMM|nr:FAD-dependent oxidoreductase [Kushneria aurantia]